MTGFYLQNYSFSAGHIMDFYLVSRDFTIYLLDGVPVCELCTLLSGHKEI